MFRQVNTRHRPFRSANTSRERGAIAVFAAVVLTVAAAAAGAALDFSRVYILRERLQQTADGVALAANAFVGDRTSANLVPIAQAYFAKHGIPSGFATVTLEKNVFDSSEGTFTVEIKGVMKTAFLGLLGLRNLTVRTKAVSLRKPGPAEIAIALDMSVSMAGLHGTPEASSPINIAKDAITSFLAALSSREDPAQTDEKKEAARVGLVFFNAYANIGRDVRVDDVGDDEVVVDDSDPEDPRKQIVTALGSPPAGWLGCVGMMAKENDDLAATKALKFIYNDTSCGGRSQDPPPTLPGMIPLQGVKNVSKSAIEAAFAKVYTVNPPTSEPWAEGWVGPFGNSYAPAGIFAAFNLLTPEAPFTTASTPLSLYQRGGRKFLILVADGYNTMVLDTAFTNGTLKSVGAELRGSLRLEAEKIQVQLCDNIKKYGTSEWDGPADGQGVVIFVIAYNFANDEASLDSLRKCASSESHFFTPSTAQQLKNAFRDIEVVMKPLRLLN